MLLRDRKGDRQERRRVRSRAECSLGWLSKPPPVAATAHLRVCLTVCVRVTPVHASQDLF